MIRALSTAATGMVGLQCNVDVIANNLANVNTVGYKRVRASFEDLLYQRLRRAGFGTAERLQPPSGIDIGVGVAVVSTDKIMTQGTLEHTGHHLDWAIDGEGFFSVQLPDGRVGYTRNGAWHIDAEGNIVDANGHRLINDSIDVPTDVTRIQVSSTGEVLGFVPGEEATPVSLGQITLFRFVNPQGLLAIGQNLFVETAASGAPISGLPGENGLGYLRHGFLEASNVEVVKELVDLITAQRAYEINANCIQSADEMLQTVNRLRG
jgi:flagellar basal-body rod protein FlgG